MELLGSPVFIGALALLILNDFALKATFHNWLTGKLSDFAGLVAFVLFGCALWPDRRRAVAAAVTLWFVYWKSPASEGLIAAANQLLPLTIGRVVDYSDLMTLPAAWLACYLSPRLRPWPLHRWAVQAIAGVSFLAFTATTTVDTRIIRESARLAPGEKFSATEVERIVDELAARYGMICVRCDELTQGRLYTIGSWWGGWPLSFMVVLDSSRMHLRYDIGAREINHPARYKKEVESLRADLELALRAMSTQLSLVKVAQPRRIAEPIEMHVGRRGGASHSDGQADAARGLALIGEIAQKHGLKRDDRAADLYGLYEGVSMFYAGALTGPDMDDRDIIVLANTRLEQWADPVIRISVKYFAPDYETTRNALVSEFEQGLKAEFGADRVSCLDWERGREVGCMRGLPASNGN